MPPRVAFPYSQAVLDMPRGTEEERRAIYYAKASERARRYRQADYERPVRIARTTAVVTPQPIPITPPRTVGETQQLLLTLSMLPTTRGMLVDEFREARMELMAVLTPEIADELNRIWRRVRRVYEDGPVPIIVNGLIVPAPTVPTPIVPPLTFTPAPTHPAIKFKMMPAHVRSLMVAEAGRTGEVWECPICKETPGNETMLMPSCAHPACEACLTEWVRSGNGPRGTGAYIGHCPTCRAPIA